MSRENTVTITVYRDETLDVDMNMANIADDGTPIQLDNAALDEVNRQLLELKRTASRILSGSALRYMSFSFGG